MYLNTCPCRLFTGCFSGCKVQHILYFHSFPVCRHNPPLLQGIHALLFSLCSSSLFLICGPDFLPTTLTISPPPTFFSQTFLCFCPSRRTEQHSAMALLTLERPPFAHCYQAKCGQACICVCVHCSFIALQAYLDIAGHLKLIIAS